MNFLYDHQLDELSKVLYDNGYDDVDFSKGILDETDLEVLDVKPDARKKLLAAIESDLQKPARSFTSFSKSITDSIKSNAYHSMNTSHEKQLTNAAEHLNHNNNSYSTIPKQKGQSNDDVNGTGSVNDWLASIRLSQYAEIFR